MRGTMRFHGLRRAIGQFGLRRRTEVVEIDGCNGVQFGIHHLGRDSLEGVHSAFGRSSACLIHRPVRPVDVHKGHELE
jgi:hypothetical protein